MNMRFKGMSVNLYIYSSVKRCPDCIQPESHCQTDSTATPQRLDSDPTATPQRPHSDSTATPQRLHSDPTATPQRPHSDPKPTESRSLEVLSFLFCLLSAIQWLYGINFWHVIFITVEKKKVKLIRNPKLLKDTHQLVACNVRSLKLKEISRHSTYESKSILLFFTTANFF